MRSTGTGLVRLGLACAVGVFLLAGGASAQSAPAPEAGSAVAETGASAKIWLGREQEIEDYLKQIEVKPDDLEAIGTGVTNPFKADLPSGGPVDAFAWKPIRAGTYGGYFESYMTEIAAYELDKLLELGMVPVTVERKVGNKKGAAAMWATDTKSFKELGGLPSAPAAFRERWTIQVLRAKMFDNLIENKDPNLGNWLKDPAWNLLLIDHSRSFGRGKKMIHTLRRVDADLWERIQKLDEPTLTAALKNWITPKQIKAIVARRDTMGKVIEGLVADKGEAAVMLRYKKPIL